MPVVQQAREAVIDCFGSRRAIRDLLELQHQPLMHCIGQKLGSGLTNLQAFIGGQGFDLTLYVIEMGNATQRLHYDLALVTNMQIKELSPQMGQTSCFKYAQSERLVITSEVIT